MKKLAICLWLMTAALTLVHCDNKTRGDDSDAAVSDNNNIDAGIRPEGGTAGLAQDYPGDIGIENDPDVIFVENFEEGSVGAVVARWTHVRWQDGISLVTDVPADSSGQHSVELTSVGQPASGDNASHLYKNFPGGFNEVYLRYYVKYVAGERYRHSGGRLGGFNPVIDQPVGIAGVQPTGSDVFSISAEPAWNSDRFDFYVYWMHMRRYTGDTAYYGNHFINDPAVLSPIDRWACIEVMVKMNDPVDSYNGELALWMDGVPIIHLGEGFPDGVWVGGANFNPDVTGDPFEGFQWRNVEALNINYIMLSQYINPNDDPAGFVGRVYIDDLVMARRYIGPITP